MKRKFEKSDYKKQNFGVFNKLNSQEMLSIRGGYNENPPPEEEEEIGIK